MITEIERVETVSDVGKKYTAVQLQHWTEHRPLDGSVQRLRTRTEWKTTCGIDLNEHNDGTFEMIQIDGTLRRI